MNLKALLPLFLFLISFYGLGQDEINFNVQTIPDVLKKNAHAVIRFEKLKIEIDSQDEMRIYGQRIITVFDEQGNSAVGAVLGYDDFTNIKKIEAEIYDASGKEIERYKKNDFLDYSAVDGGTLYSDSRVLFMNYMPLSYPYSVQFTYQINTPNTAAIYSWRPIRNYFVSVEESQYEVIDYAGLGLRFKEKSFQDFEIESSKSDSSLYYQLNNVKAFKPEDLSPNISEITPSVLSAVEFFHFNGVDGQAKNWKDFGTWVNSSLLSGRDAISYETKQKIEELTDGLQDPLDKAKRIYEFVQNNTRYISVQVGIGGVQPITALEVDKLKYGDCKGLTNYTQALLKHVGVESYYTIVQAGRTIEDLEDDFATLEQGNHIILGIPDDDDIVWVDCTSQVHPFGFIGDFTDSRKVLMIKPNESEIVKTTTYDEYQNYQQTQANVQLNAEGDIKALVKIKTNGIQYDSRFFLKDNSSKNQLDHYKSYWKHVNNLNILSKSFDNDRDSIAFKEVIKLNAKKYASKSIDRLIFSPNIFNQNSYVPDRYRSRKFQLVIQRGYLDHDHFEIEIPEGYQIEAIPDKFEIKNKFGEYAIESLQFENKIKFNRKLLIKDGTYPKSEYSNYRDFRKEIAKHDTSIIVLKRIL